MDFEKVLRIIQKRQLFFVAAASIVALVSIVLIVSRPPQYESHVKVLVTTERRFTGAAGSYKEELPQLAEMIRIELQRNIATQIEIIKSKPVVDGAVRVSGVPRKDVVFSVQRLAESDVVQITGYSSDPGKLKRFLDAIGDSYVRYVQNLRINETRDAGRFLEEQIVLARDELRDSESGLRDFKEFSGIVDLSQESSRKVASLVDFESQLENLKIDLSSVRSRLGEIRSQLSSGEKEMVSSTVLSENPLLQQMRGRLASLEVEHAGLSRTLARRHPKLMGVEAEIEKAKSTIRDEVERIVSSQTRTLNPVHIALMTDLTDYSVEEISLASRRDALESVIAGMKRDLLSIPESEMELARLTRRKMLNERLLLVLEEKYQDFKVSERTRTPPARIIESAAGALEISGKKKLFQAVVMFLVAVSFGLGVALFAEYMDDAIYTDEDVRRHLELKVLAQIPFDKAIERNPLIAFAKPNSPVSESFRSLRSKLKYIIPDFRGKTLLVTSSIIEEGKSFVASNLAVTIAQYDYSALLVDGDLRRPSLHAYFGVENRGLTNVLINNEDLESVIARTPVRGLDLLCSGPLPLIETSPFNSSELLESKKTREIFETLRNTYDVVIVDSPPVLVLTDVLSLSAQASGILLVIDSGYVKRAETVEAKAELEVSSAPILGAILNKSEGRSKGYYKYMYYYKESPKNEIGAKNG
ncbi:MAG: polysaccharide biosynthesis tyrosine autokinase [bacterium]